MLSLDELESLFSATGAVGEEQESLLLEVNGTDGALFREAAVQGHLNVVKFFLEAKDWYDMTPAERQNCSNSGAKNSLGTTPLHLAASKGHTAIVECLLSSGVFVDEQNGNKETALYLAVMQGHEHVVQLLCERGANVNHYIEQVDQSIIEIAAYEGHSTIVEILLCFGAEHKNALWLSVSRGHEGVVRTLLQSNADPSCQYNCKTALQIAAMNGHLVICQLLLDAKANVESFDDKRWTALHWAVHRGHLPIVELLLKRNARVNARGHGDHDESSLEIALRNGDRSIALLLRSYGGVMKKECYLEDAIAKGRLLAVMSLFSMGAEPQIPRTSTPLHDACVSNHVDIVRFLLQRKMDVNARDGDGFTPLHSACTYYGDRNAENETIVQILLDHGAMANAANDFGQTALFLTKSLRLRSILISKGADPNVTDMSGRTLLHDVSKIELASQLLHYKVLVDAKDKHSRTPLHSACCDGYQDIAELLIENGASVNTRDVFGLSPLDFCLCQRYSSLGTILVENHDFDVNMRDHEGQTALHLAAFYGETEIIKLLLVKNAAVDAKDVHGNTSLHFAARRGHFLGAGFLMLYNASVNAVNSDGDTPLHLALTEEMVDMLLQRGADYTLRNRKEKTPVDLAFDCKRVWLFKVFLKAITRNC